MKMEVLSMTQKRKLPKTKHSGISLIELLVVIAVLVLIMSILAPSVCRAKERARQMVCQSNLHQQGALMMTYAANNNETYPVAPRYYPYGGLINWENKTCWKLTYQPAAQMALYSQEYTIEPTLFYCPSGKTGSSNDVNLEDHWETPARQYPKPNRFFIRCYYTYVTYATWPGFGYDTLGEATVSCDPKPEATDRLEHRVARNAMSRCDTVVLSDIIQETTSIDAPKLNNHSRRGIPRGGNVQYNDGSVRWRHFDETEPLVQIPDIESCFRL